MIKYINGFEGLYRVTSNGIIFNKEGRKNSQHTLNSGYKYVDLYKNGNRTRKMIHRIVAETFLNPIEGKSIVNHKDGCKTNNDISNLEWSTYSENTKHAFDNGLIEVKNRKIRTDYSGVEKAVIKMDLDGNELERYESAVKAIKDVGLKNSGNISSCCKGEKKTCGGFKWKYAS